MSHKPTPNNSFTMPTGDVGILVSFTQADVELLAFHCASKQSVPSLIKQIIKTWLNEPNEE